MIIAASYIHDIGIHEVKGNIRAPTRITISARPPIAWNILERLGADRDMIDEVCNLIAHRHSPRKIQTFNFQIL